MRVTRGLAVADFDLDGNLDILTNDQDGPPELLRYCGPSTRHWFALDTRGTKSNPDGYHARVTIRAGTGRSSPRSAPVRAMPRPAIRASTSPRRRDDDREVKIVWHGSKTVTRREIYRRIGCMGSSRAAACSRLRPLRRRERHETEGRRPSRDHRRTERLRLLAAARPGKTVQARARALLYRAGSAAWQVREDHGSGHPVQSRDRAHTGGLGALHRAGGFYEAVERSDLAIETLEQLQAVDPKAKHLTCRLAEAHLGAGDTAAAKEWVEKAVAEEPDSARALSVYGLAMMAFRYYDTAAAMLEGAPLAPGRRIGQSLVDVTLQQAKYAEATRLGRACGEGAGFGAPALPTGLGYSRETGNREATAKAIAHLEKAIALSPQWFEPCAELGRLYRSLGRNDEALGYFERAWKLNSTAPGVAYNLAGILRQRGDPRAAAMEQTYRRLLAGKERFTQMRLYFKSDSENAAKAVALAQSEAANGQYGMALYRFTSCCQPIRTTWRRLNSISAWTRGPARAIPTICGPVRASTCRAREPPGRCASYKATKTQRDVNGRWAVAMA